MPATTAKPLGKEYFCGLPPLKLRLERTFCPGVVADANRPEGSLIGWRDETA